MLSLFSGFDKSLLFNFSSNFEISFSLAFTFLANSTSSGFVFSLITASTRFDILPSVNSFCFLSHSSSCFLPSFFA